MDKLIEKLKELGLSTYDSKVYISLLKKFPATGYEVSQMADIPQARAYDALKSLEKNGIVSSDNQKPQKYSPISPKELTKRYKRKFNSTIDFLEKKLPNQNQNYNEPIQYVNGFDEVIKKAIEIIKNAKHSIYIECWGEDFKFLAKDLRLAYDREIDVKIVGCDGIDANFGLIYNQFMSKETENKFGRMIYLIADNNECLFGKVEGKVIWTQNSDISFLIKEYIVQNMYLLDIAQNFPEQLKYFYGLGLKRLRDKIR